jgi:hypothetical protein
MSKVKINLNKSVLSLLFRPKTIYQNKMDNIVVKIYKHLI